MSKTMLVLLWTFLLLSVSSYAQTVPIKGKIMGNNHEPIADASIQVKRSNTGAFTNMAGEFTINALATDTLLISAVGFEMKEVAINGRSEINETLNVTNKQLNEVVVVGYGTQKKVNLTGAVSVVDAKTFESRPVQNAAQMLQGVAPGLNITQTAGSLEDRPSINIRGVGTIGQGSSGSPLVLIDGAEGDINTINPQDIESISVLKDAASSSIYGTRAPFGVILVTTKRGSKGRSQINYNNNLRNSSPVLLPKMMNALDFATYFNEASTNGGGGLVFAPERIERIKDYMAGTLKESVIIDPNNTDRWHEGYYGGNDNVDWYKALFRDNVFSHEHNISVSGGNNSVQYYVSGQYLKQDGLMQFNQDIFKRYTVTGRITGKINEWATIGYNARFAREDYSRPSKLTNTLFTDLARQGWPTLPLYDPNGYLFSSPSPALGLAEGGQDIRQNDWMYQQVHLTLEPIKNWKIHAMVNYRVRNNFRHWDALATYNHDVNGNPVIYDRESHVHEDAWRENYNNNSFYTEYARSFAAVHNVKFTGGMQTEYNRYRDLGVSRNGIILPGQPVIDLTTGTTSNGQPATPSVNGKYQEWTNLGYFGRINYDYDGRYLLELNLRRDAASRFREDKRWFWSPSVSAGWNIASEKFWNRYSDVVNIFKLRGSYGKLGNQNTTDLYPTYVVMPVGTSNGGWLVGGVRPNTANAPGLVSTLLTWESVRTWNVGVDLAFLSGRITTSFDYFTRYTDNMVGPAPELPVILGTAVPRTNNTFLKTYGFEWELGWNGKLKNGMALDARLVLSDAVSEVTDFPQNFTGSIDQYRKGQKLGEIWGYETIGIAKTQKEMDDHLATLPNGGQVALGPGAPGAGDIMYRDLNGDGKIDAGARTVANSGDLKIIGNNTPRYLIGFTLNANWKGFDFRAFFQGVLKRDVFMDSYYFWGASRSGLWWSAGLEEHKDYFRADENHTLGQNLDSYYPRPLFGSFADKNQQYQTRYLLDASYVRLKNLQLGYTLPARITNKVSVSKMRVYIAGENLVTFTNMTKLFDPETIVGGWGGNVYPLMKVMSAGVSVNF
jgi:TonB-linked outer membrane protein, SusC/RagA family